MPSTVDLANAALDLLGEESITSLTDDAERARVINRRYPLSRDAELRGHPWNFALSRATLPLLVDAPAWGFGRQFQLPSDCLRVLRMGYEGARFKIEGRKLLTDDSTAEIQYLARVEDPNQWDALFFEMLAARLAADVCVRITQSRTLLETMLSIYKDRRSEALAADAQEGSVDQFTADEWLNGRAIGVDTPFSTNGDTF